MIKPINSSELKQLLRFAYPERKLLIWGTLFLVLGSLVLLAFPQAVRITMDEALETKNLALNNLMKGRTVLIIAHRLSTVKDTDRVIVLNKGVIVEEGHHDELIKNQGGIYFNLVQKQLSSH